MVARIYKHGGCVGEDVEIGFSAACVDVVDIHLATLPSTIRFTHFVRL
jgi:hypothetical protein